MESKPSNLMLALLATLAGASTRYAAFDCGMDTGSAAAGRAIDASDEVAARMKPRARRGRNRCAWVAK